MQSLSKPILIIIMVYNMSKTNEVVRLDHKVRFQKDLQNLVSSMQFMPWNIRVASIADACGLTVSTLLASDDATPMIGSLASKMEHETIKSFVTADQQEYGLGLDWAEWQDDVLACNYKSSFGIYSDTPKDILSEYRDVTKVLGREPSNSSEYHKAKDAVLLQQKQEMEEHSKQIINEMHARISSLIISSDADKKLYEMELEKTSRLERELLNAMESTSAQVTSAIEMARKERDEALLAQKQGLESQFNLQVVQIQDEARRSIEAVNQKMNELRDIYNENNFVPRQEYAVLLEEANRERSLSRASQVKINELNEEVAKQKAIISEQNQLVDALNNQMEDIKNNSSEGLPVVFQSLNNKISTLEGYVERFREKNASLKEKLQAKNALYNKQKKELSMVKKKCSSLTKVFAVSVVGSLVCLSYLAYCLSA